MNNCIDFLARYIHSMEKVLFKKLMLTEFDHILGTRGKEFLKTNLKTNHTFPDSSHCIFSGALMKAL